MLLFGGKLNKFISHMISKILSKDLQRDLSYSGHRTTNKALSMYSSVVNLLHTSAKAKFSSYEIDDGIEIISKLLKRA